MTAQGDEVLKSKDLVTPDHMLCLHPRVLSPVELPGIIFRVSEGLNLSRPLSSALSRNYSP